MCMMTQLLLLAQQVAAHPFAKEEYSLRTAIKVSEKGVVPLVALELPIDVVLKGIGTEKEDPREVKKRKIRQYNERQWKLLAESLVFTIDGRAVDGEWLAIEHPSNGKAAEGFFVYLVSFRHDGPSGALDDGSIIEIENKAYLDAGKLQVGVLDRGMAWLDTGTHPSLMQASQFVQVIEERQGLKIGCLEEIAWRMGFIDDAQLESLAQPLLKSGYGTYLMNILQRGL